MSNINVNNITPLAGTSGTVSVSGSLHVSGNLSANGTLTLGDANTDNILLNAELSSSLIPDVNNQFDIGSLSKQWKDLYIDGHAHIDSASFNSISSSLSPHFANGFDLGNYVYQWRELHIKDLHNYNTASLNVISMSATATTNGGVQGHFLPTARNQYDLGSNNKQWKDLHIDGTAYIDNISGVTNIVATSASITYISSSSPTVFAGGIEPDQDDDNDIGSSTKQWKNLYIDGTAYIDSASIEVLYPRGGVTYAGQTFIRVSGSLYPENYTAAAGGFTLGARGGAHPYRLWKGVHAVTASLDKISSSLIPDKDNTYDLGSTTYEWKDLYIDGTANIDTGSISYIISQEVRIEPPATLGFSAALHVSGTVDANKYVEVIFDKLPNNPAGLPTGSLWASGSEVIGGQAHATLRIKI